MTDDGLTPGQVAALTRAVDISAPPPDGEPVALVLFGTNQQDAPVRIAAGRYHAGVAPLVIATGGINRHDGSTEGREFARRLAVAGVPASAVRVEDRSKDTWQNVELALPYLRERTRSGSRLSRCPSGITCARSTACEPNCRKRCRCTRSGGSPVTAARPSLARPGRRFPTGAAESSARPAR